MQLVDARLPYRPEHRALAQPPPHELERLPSMPHVAHQNLAVKLDEDDPQRPLFWERHSQHVGVCT